jgi:hypothetical protein
MQAQVRELLGFGVGVDGDYATFFAKFIGK